MGEGARNDQQGGGGEPALVMVTGSRRWRDEGAVWSALDAQLARLGPQMVVLEGECATGADAHARAWCATRGVARRGFPPAPRSGRDGFLARNAAMVAAGPAVVLAFLDPGSRGTWHAVTCALEAGVAVRAFSSVVADEVLVGRARQCAARLVADGGWRSARRRALALACSSLVVGQAVPAGVAEAIEEELRR